MATWHIFVPALIFLMLLAAFGPQARQARAANQIKILSWADENTPEWDRRLNISGLRMGCSAEPANCLKAAASKVEHHPETKVFLSIVLNLEVAVSYARQYSKLSQQYPFLTEVDVDDFVGEYAELYSKSASDPLSMLDSMIGALKSQDRGLHFGITLYENELESSFLKEPKMTAAIRSKVDTAHLFLIYRANAPNYANYVRQSKKIFPNAKVIAGVYAYDRISYVPCSPNVSRACSTEEEIGLFKQALDTQVRLAKSGDVEWLEFFPGAFGKEDDWNAWDRPRICPGRKQECITNTKQMRQLVSAAFSKKLDRKQ